MAPSGPPDADDPTAEEQAPECDGSSTDQLDDTYRLRVASASESLNGTVAFDDRGQPRWKWVTELGGAANTATGTFDQLKALENPALTLADDATSKPQRPSEHGYDPYSTGMFAKPKLRP